MFARAVCAEMVFRDLPFEQRVRRIAELGFMVEIWSWTNRDIGALVRTGATFSSMTGYLTGSLADEDGARDLLRTAEQAIAVASQLGCPRPIRACRSRAPRTPWRWWRPWTGPDCA